MPVAGPSRAPSLLGRSKPRWAPRQEDARWAQEGGYGGGEPIHRNRRSRPVWPRLGTRHGSTQVGYSGLRGPMAQTPRGGLYGPLCQGYLGVAIYSETTVILLL